MITGEKKKRRVKEYLTDVDPTLDLEEIWIKWLHGVKARSWTGEQ